MPPKSNFQTQALFILHSLIHILLAISGTALICSQLFNVSIIRLYKTSFYFHINNKNEKLKLLLHWLCFFMTEVLGRQILTQAVIYTMPGDLHHVT